MSASKCQASFRGYYCSLAAKHAGDHRHEGSMKKIRNWGESGDAKIIVIWPRPMKIPASDLTAPGRSAFDPPPSK